MTFGSSFNVVHQQAALAETARILKHEGWFVCLWNHRRLDDPVQAEIERIISAHVPNYSYGTRREDQSEVLEASGLFGPVIQVCGRVTHEQAVDACVEAWRSHATLSRQAGDAFPATVDAIATFLQSLGRQSIEIPYVTTSWLAQLK